MKPKCLKGAIINIQVCKKSWKEKSIGCKMSLIGGKTTKKRFIEQWTSKWCGKVGDALHLTIKANLPLVTMMYHMPFYGFAPPICKYNMWNAKLTIVKCEAQQDDQDALQMALINLIGSIKDSQHFLPLIDQLETTSRRLWRCFDHQRSCANKIRRRSNGDIISQMFDQKFICELI